MSKSIFSKLKLTLLVGAVAFAALAATASQAGAQLDLEKYFEDLASSTAVDCSKGPQIFIRDLQTGADVSVVEVGKEYRVDGFCLKPNSQVHLMISSTIIDLGYVTTDAQGAFSARVKIPSLSAGEHTLTASGVDTKDAPVSASAKIIVGSNPAFTGSSDLSTKVGTGAALVLAGAGVVIAVRRRRASEAA